MNKLAEAIKTTKRLIDLPYNLFNLDNFWSILDKNYPGVEMIETDINSPIQLMSGNNSQAGIAKLGKGNIYIIGKGIMFDSGGLNLKDDRNMNNMHDDKAGALIALAIAQLLPEKVTALCPFTTNFLQNSLITPGDVLKIGQRKVEVVNTDAEGRLILAEAISHLNVSENDIIITVATLTGCVAYAVGTKATGVFSDNEKLLRKYADASFEAEEWAWGLPMWSYLDESYKKQKVLKNCDDEAKCGATTAAVFLKQFIKYPDKFLHLDIASSAFDKNGKANGVPIKSLINFIRRIK